MENRVDQIGTAIIFEDEHIRVWLLDLPPHGASEWHDHHNPYRYVVTRPGLVATEYEDGHRELQDDVVSDTRFQSADARHRLVNLSNSTYQNVVIEFLRVR